MKRTGNRLTIIVEGFCDGPEECDLDGWTYSVISEWPSHPQTVETSGVIRGRFPQQITGWWQAVLKQIQENSHG